MVFGLLNAKIWVVSRVTYLKNLSATEEYLPIPVFQKIILKIGKNQVFIGSCLPAITDSSWLGAVCQLLKTVVGWELSASYHR